MNIFGLLILTLTSNAEAGLASPAPTDPDQKLERTSFQNQGPYDPRIDIKSDVAMVYGIDSGLPERIESWRREGYRIHVMTGVAWGAYKDFLDGKFDGIQHWDAAQTDRNGNRILHAGNPDVPYMCPTEEYGRYLCVGVKRAIDAGAEAIHLEEPEFWVRGGYCEAFKREWQSYYGEQWVPPHSSPDAQYRASKLKYYLYRRALSEVFRFIRDYGRKIGRAVKCYVPTHSMINYAWWGIVSPEQSLVQIEGCDGYIGQVWTGTARTPNRYRGIIKERTFETAFFEYGVLHNLVRSTGKRMWYLNDPVEDNPNHSWADYKRNWESTLVASLLWPDVWRYEVMPWPSRVFMDSFPRKDISERKPDEEVERELIPASYATELLTVINELNKMDQKEVTWDSGTRGIGILVSDTMMFQRGEPSGGDGAFGSFFGLALPIIKHGTPVEPVQLENVVIPGYLKPYKVLFLTYEGMKPTSPNLHEALAEWVRAGGVLVFVDDDKDPYNSVREWWNTPPFPPGGIEASRAKIYPTPRLHLFEKLGVSGTGTHRVGKGAVIYSAVSPASLSMSDAGARKTIALAEEACRLAHIEWRPASHLLLRRGPYIIAAGLDETPELPERRIEGAFLDLFSPALEIVRTVRLEPGSRRFLLDLGKLEQDRPSVLASASKILGVEVNERSMAFHSEGPAGTICATRLRLPSAPKSIAVDGSADAAACEWDAASGTALLRYDNSAEGRWLEVNW